MVTTPITNQAYHIAFLSLVDNYLHENEDVSKLTSEPLPLVPALSPEYTTLFPDQTYPSMLAVTSPWIDLGSKDPMIAHVSRQVFNQEIAYAAFCGLSNIIVPGPAGSHKGKLRETDVAQYARTIASALSIGPYYQLHISLPMHQLDETNQEPKMKSLASRARVPRTKSSSEESLEESWLAPWEAWDLIRSVCKYDTRLSVGMHTILRSLVLLTFVSLTDIQQPSF